MGKTYEGVKWHGGMGRSIPLLFPARDQKVQKDKGEEHVMSIVVSDYKQKW